jgi:4-hydroxybenzoate polyprenyltransferase
VWLATLLWTFGFDTVYAMADRDDDRAIGVRSSALSLGQQAPLAVGVSYGLAALALSLAAGLQGCGWITWPLLLLAAAGMQREAALLRRPQLPRSAYGRHFSRQVQLGGLMLLALVLGQLP